METAHPSQNPGFDSTYMFMTTLGVKPSQASAFLSVARDPSLITTQEKLSRYFLAAGYEEKYANGLAEFFLMKRKRGEMHS